MFALAALAAVIELVVGVLVGGRTPSALEALEKSVDYAATAHALQLSLVLNGITDAALLAFFAWASGAVWKRNAWVRPLIVVKAVIEANLAVAGHILVGTAVGPATLHVILWLAFDAALLVVLWTPLASRRWFGDVGAATIADLWPSRPAGPSPSSPRTAPPHEARPVLGHAAERPPPAPVQYAVHHRVPAPRLDADDDPVTVRLVIPRDAGRRDVQPAPPR